MTLSATELAAVTAELAPLVGGRIQKVDLVAEREAVVEVRVPGRTLRLLISARPGAGRVHLVERRPDREVPAGPVQSLLRRRLAGQPVFGLASEGRTFYLDTPAVRWVVRIDGGRDAFRIIAPVGLEPPDESTEIPDRFERSQDIAARYEARLPEVTTASLRQRLLAAVAKRRKKIARLEKNVARDVERLEAMASAGHFGELMKPVLHTIRRGATSVTVTDWATSQSVEVPLDPALGPKGNLERYFTRAKKAARGLPVATARRDEIRERLRTIDEERDRITDADDEGLERIAKGIVELDGVDASRIEATSKKKAKTKPVDRWSRRFESADGTEILVGRGAKENDRLTFNGSKADDFWLHARGTAGAHVILRNEKGRAPTSESLLDAAHLAAFYSSAKGEAKVEVIYTEARHVKKTKGAPAGRVGVAKSKTMLVQMDEARLDRLLGREGAPRT